MNIRYWLKHPELIGARISYRLWEMAHPGCPWLCPQTVAFLERYLSRSMSVLEFGSGRSTQWLAQRVGKLTSIEYDPAWYRRVRDQLQGVDTRTVSLRYIALDHPYSEPERETYDRLPQYVDVLDEFADRSLDVIIVDGHYRTTVLRHCAAKVKSGGILLVDDMNLWLPGGPPVPPEFVLVDQATNGIKWTGIWEARRATEARL
jgi:predicted O-methyltransferase YrrM